VLLQSAADTPYFSPRLFAYLRRYRVRDLFLVRAFISKVQRRAAILEHWIAEQQSIPCSHEGNAIRDFTIALQCE
jgi:hypothetical protein